MSRFPLVGFTRRNYRSALYRLSMYYVFEDSQTFITKKKWNGSPILKTRIESFWIVWEKFLIRQRRRFRTRLIRFNSKRQNWKRIERRKRLKKRRKRRKNAWKKCMNSARKTILSGKQRDDAHKSVDGFSFAENPENSKWVDSTSNLPVSVDVCC